MSEYKTEMVREGVIALPPMTVASFTILGMSPSDFLIMLSIVWLLLQIGHWGYLRGKEVMRNRLLSDDKIRVEVIKSVLKEDVNADTV